MTAQLQKTRAALRSKSITVNLEVKCRPPNTCRPKGPAHFYPTVEQSERITRKADIALVLLLHSKVFFFGTMKYI